MINLKPTLVDIEQRSKEITSLLNKIQAFYDNIENNKIHITNREEFGVAVESLKQASDIFKKNIKEIKSEIDAYNSTKL